MERKLKPGTVFIGNVNNIVMELAEIQKSSTSQGNETAVIREVETGNLFTYGLDALERCDITILEQGKVSLP